MFGAIVNSSYTIHIFQQYVNEATSEGTLNIGGEWQRSTKNSQFTRNENK